MIIAGLMSGSSLDGLDIVICDFEWNDHDQIEWDILHHQTKELCSSLSSKLSQATSYSPKELLKLDYEFAQFCADATRELLAAKSISCDYIASHGHTIYHAPEDGYSYQIGNGASIAALSNIPTIADFRMNDIAIGGQGAPIVPIVERLLFPEVRYFLNLGGIANISIHGEEVLAFDVCPCNQVLNKIASTIDLEYDDGGQLAAQGEVSNEVISEWNKMAYFDLPPPKSLDNTWVQQDFYKYILKHNLSPNDALATMCQFAADHIVNALLHNDQQANGRFMITGGGRYNDHLIKLIKQKLPEQIVIVNLPNRVVDMKEAILMALMGFLRVSEIPNTIPSVTGAKRPTCSGGLYLP